MRQVNLEICISWLIVADLFWQWGGSSDPPEPPQPTGLSAIIRYGSGSGRVLSLTTTTRFYYVKEKNIKGTVGGYPYQGHDPTCIKSKCQRSKTVRSVNSLAASYQRKIRPPLETILRIYFNLGGLCSAGPRDGKFCAQMSNISKGNKRRRRAG